MDVPPPSEPSNYPRPGSAQDRTGLREIATAQRQVLYCVLLQFAVIILNVFISSLRSAALSMVVLVVLVGLLIYMILSVIKLTKALGDSPILYVVLMFIPCVSLIALLVLSNKATKRLQTAGMKVGLLGADPNSI